MLQKQKHRGCQAPQVNKKQSILEIHMKMSKDSTILVSPTRHPLVHCSILITLQGGKHASSGNIQRPRGKAISSRLSGLGAYWHVCGRIYRRRALLAKY